MLLRILSQILNNKTSFYKMGNPFSKNKSGSKKASNKKSYVQRRKISISSLQENKKITKSSKKAEKPKVHKVQITFQPSCNISSKQKESSYNITFDQKKTTYNVPSNQKKSTYNVPSKQKKFSNNTPSNQKKTSYNVPSKPTYNVPSKQKASAGAMKFDLATFEQGLLDQHNSLRARHDAGPLAIREDLTNHARWWAAELAKKGSMVHSTDSDFGENLAFTTKSGVTR